MTGHAKGWHILFSMQFKAVTHNLNNVLDCWHGSGEETSDSHNQEWNSCEKVSCRDCNSSTPAVSTTNQKHTVTLISSRAKLVQMAGKSSSSTPIKKDAFSGPILNLSLSFPTIYVILFIQRKCRGMSSIYCLQFSKEANFRSNP